MLTKWVVPSENVPSSMRNICGFTSLCTCVTSYPGICSSLKHSIVFSNTACGQQRPLTDCIDAQADLGLCICPETSFQIAQSI